MGGPSSLRLVCFDLDGTITLVHGWEPIARAQGRLEEFREAQAQFHRGGVSEGAHLVKLLNLGSGLALSELDGILERTPKLSHLGETVEALHDQGSKVALLTHNPGYICRWYAERYGFDLYAGVRQPVRGGRVQPVRRMSVDKRDGLLLLLRWTGAGARTTAHLGDGLADAAVFPYVGTAIAVNTSLPEVKAAADASVRTRDARDLLPFLRTPLRSTVRPLSSSRPRAFGSFHAEWTGEGTSRPAKSVRA